MKIALTPKWSSSAGVDAYGRWAVVPIGKHHIRLRYLPAGSVMSSSGTPILVTVPFWLAETEIPQLMWSEFMRGFFSSGNPSLHRGDNLPVHNMSREDCDRFIAICNERLKLENRHAMVRLPTLAEWRFTAISAHVGVDAIMRGTLRRYDDRDRVLLVYAAENGDTPAPVGSGRRDQWGVSDLLGNVGEWVSETNQDGAWWCGGNWTMPRAACLPEAMSNSAIKSPQVAVGLRLVVMDAQPAAIKQP
jgi:formylglycine-generating enzyme required for sulfatase activity